MAKKSKDSKPLKALLRAVEIAGGRQNLAEKVGCKSLNHVNVMINRDKKASVKYVAKISEVTGVPCHELRPDIFPPPSNDDSYQPNSA